MVTFEPIETPGQTITPPPSQTLSPMDIGAASSLPDRLSSGPHNFATDYLMPTSNGSRRRPGPSLAPFKGMAKEVNPRLKG